MSRRVRSERGPRGTGSVSTRAFIAAAAATITLMASPIAAQNTELCMEAERFLRDEMGMEAITEPDTIDDWRTQAMVPGCRVTAAGATRDTPTRVARGFFEVLEASVWTRTPDPQDAPNEASLRYRRLGADCLFTYYDGSSTLNTEAEFTVSDAVDMRPGDRLYYFLVMCTPAAPAAERGVPIDVARVSTALLLESL